VDVEALHSDAVAQCTAATTEVRASASFTLPCRSASAVDVCVAATTEVRATAYLHCAPLGFSCRCACRGRHAEEVRRRSLLHFTTALAARPPPSHLLFPAGARGRSVARLVGAATASSSRRARLACQHPSLGAARPAKSYSPVTFPPDVFSLPHLQFLFFVDDVACADELIRVRLHDAPPPPTPVLAQQQQ
jgi:electron transfer flavoprotein alpha subunit